MGCAECDVHRAMYNVVDAELSVAKSQIASLRLDLERVLTALDLLWDEATDQERCSHERTAGMYEHQLSEPCRRIVRDAMKCGKQ